MIGVFDSGVGGLSILKNITKELPGYHYVYLADNARNPYGNHSKETVTNYTRQAVNYLFDYGAKMIIIACYSASSLALRTIQDEMLVKKNIKDRKILGVLRPVVEKAVQLTKNKRIGVIATRATTRSMAFESEIAKLDKSIKVYTQDCPLLVPLIEEQWGNKPETRKILKSYLRKLKTYNVDNLILGCTHYPLIQNTIEQIMTKNVNVPSVGGIVAKSLKEYLIRHPEIEKELKKNKGGYSVDFLNTDKIPEFVKIGNKFLGHKITNIKKVDLSDF